MTPIYRIIKVQLRDLQKPTIICGNCQAEIIFEIGKTPPVQCPCCSNRIDDSMKTAIAALVRIHLEAPKSPSFSMEFSIQEVVNDPSMKEMLAQNSGRVK